MAFRKSRIIALILLLFVLGLAGCTFDSGDSTNTVTDITWELSTISAQGEVTSVGRGASYTLILREDDTFRGQADCNEIGGTYSGNYSFVLTSTSAECGEDSLSARYQQILSNVVSGGPSGDNFALETAGGAERLEFTNSGRAR